MSIITFPPILSEPIFSSAKQMVALHSGFRPLPPGAAAATLPVVVKKTDTEQDLREDPDAPLEEVRVGKRSSRRRAPAHSSSSLRTADGNCRFAAPFACHRCAPDPSRLDTVVDPSSDG